MCSWPCPSLSRGWPCCHVGNQVQTLSKCVVSGPGKVCGSSILLILLTSVLSGKGRTDVDVL